MFGCSHRWYCTYTTYMFISDIHFHLCHTCLHLSYSTCPKVQCHSCSHPWYCTYTCSYPKYMSPCSLVSYILRIHIKRMFKNVHVWLYIILTLSLIFTGIPTIYSNLTAQCTMCIAHGTLCSRIGANTRMTGVQPCYQRYIMHQFSTELKVSPLTLVPPTWGWQNTVKQKRFTVHISNIHHDLQGVPKKVTYRICWSHGAPAKSL